MEITLSRVYEMFPSKNNCLKNEDTNRPYPRNIRCGIVGSLNGPKPPMGLGDALDLFDCAPSDRALETPNEA